MYKFCYFTKNKGNAVVNYTLEIYQITISLKIQSRTTKSIAKKTRHSELVAGEPVEPSESVSKKTKSFPKTKDVSR